MANAVKRQEAGTTLTREAFRARMESQCRQIESYRRAVCEESGREISLEDAAKEWIERYAASFDWSEEGSCA